MPNYEAKLEISHSCNHCDFTRRFPGSRIVSWDNTSNYVMEVTSEDEAALDIFVKEYICCDNSPQVFRGRNKIEVVSKICTCNPNSATALIARADCWYAQPAIAQSGWEYYRVYSWERENFAKIIDLVKQYGGEVHLRSLKNICQPCVTPEMLIPSESILAGLTKKQIQTLVEAYQLGYFDLPARIDANEMAKRVGLSRSTFSEHLRKAEGKVIGNVFPVLKLLTRELEILEEES
jgi:predicted DNA binding protein